MLQTFKHYKFYYTLRLRWSLDVVFHAVFCSQVAILSYFKRQDEYRFAKYASYAIISIAERALAGMCIKN